MILKKPCETPSRLNLAHPHAQGLVASYLFNGQGHKVFDYTCNQNELSVVGASYVADGLQCKANNEIATLDNTGQKVVHQDQGTVLMYYKSYAAINDNTFHLLFGALGIGYTANDFYIAKDGDNKIYIWIRDTSNHYIACANSNFPDWQTGFLLGAHWDKNNVIHSSVNLAISVNGVYITPSNKVSATTWDVTVHPLLGVLNDPDNQIRYADGMVKHLYIYNENIPINTTKEVHKDPYAMYDVYSNIMFSFFFSVSIPLVITTQPENTTVAKETDASFSVEATGSGTLTYQWYRNSELQAGETASTYSFTTALSNNNDSVYCIVSDDNSSLQSDTVFLTVVSCVMNTSADALEEKDYPIPQKIEYKEAHEK